jgi:predicted phage tail component-like protein
MLNGFTFDGIHSGTFGIAAKSVDRSLLPAMKRREIELSRKHGYYDFGDNVYLRRSITVGIVFYDETMIQNKIKAREIAKWLGRSKNPKKLIFDDEPDKYYMARIYSAVNMSGTQAIVDSTLEFDCQPFAYSPFDTGVNNTWGNANFPWATTGLTWGGSNNYSFIATSQTSYDFDNFASQEIGVKSPQTSKNRIIINGSWDDLEITLNDKTLEYTDADSGELVIDCVNLECTLNGNNALGDLDGDLEEFLPIVSGINTITVDGTNFNITVLIDFRPEWR